MAPTITRIESTEFSFPLEDTGHAIDDEGAVPVPDGPGLGVDYDWDYVEEHGTGSVHVYE